MARDFRIEIARTTAAIREDLERGATEDVLAQTIRAHAKSNVSSEPTFDPYELRILAATLAKEEATRASSVVLVRALTTALPDDGYGWATRALIGFFWTKDKRDTILAASRAIARGRGDADLFLWRGSSLLERGEAVAAAADFEQGLATQPSAQTRLDLENRAREANYAVGAIRILDECSEDIEKARMSSDELVRAWSSVPLTSLDLSSARAGERVLAPDMEWTVHVSYSVAEHAYSKFEKGEIRLARAAFEALVLVNHTDPYMHLMLAACEAKLGNEERAIREYDEVIRLEPTSIAGLVNRGEILLHRGQAGAALEDLTAAIELNPAGDDPHANRARAICWAIGDVLPEYAAQAREARGPLRLGSDVEAERQKIAAKLRSSRVVGEPSPLRRFDVFLSHNSCDKPMVRRLKTALAERGIRAWLDEDELQPGLPWLDQLDRGIRASAAVAVVIAADGLGPWAVEEMRSALMLAVHSKAAVIPVLIPGAPAKPDLPLFLAGRMWVDLRGGFDDERTLGRLIWGIQGKQPEA